MSRWELVQGPQMSPRVPEQICLGGLSLTLLRVPFLLPCSLWVSAPCPFAPFLEAGCAALGPAAPLKIPTAGLRDLGGVIPA